MKYYVWIYLGIIAFSLLSAIIFIIYKSIVQRKINKDSFSDVKLYKYSEDLKKFKEKYNVSYNDSITEISEKLGFKIVECEKKDMEKGYDGRINDKQIKILKSLTSRQKNMVIAHEIAHFLTNSKVELVDGCKTKSIFLRKENEQICDYIASVLLLSNEELRERIDKHNFYNLHKNMRKQFIFELADEKNISTNLIMKRIKEIKQINVNDSFY